MNENKDSMTVTAFTPGLGFGKGQTRPVTLEEMRQHAANLRIRASEVESAAFNRLSSIPSPMVTGASKYRKTFGKKNDRAIAGLENAGAKAADLRKAAEKWDSRANAIDPVVQARKTREREVKEEVRLREKMIETATRKAAPILNRPTAKLHMTSKEWAEIHNDYKAISVRDGYRIREKMCTEVFLTDKKAVAA